MREIKFRAFDKITKKHTTSGLYFNNSTMTLEKTPNIILQQSTGLKDKNEVDIYEGDIVVWKVNDITRTAEVYYDELQASFWMGKSKENGFLTLNDWMRGEHEVIGNIHENPELLAVPTAVL